jgi:hypothetical protein
MTSFETIFFRASDSTLTDLLQLAISQKCSHRRGRLLIILAFLLQNLVWDAAMRTTDRDYEQQC